MSMGIRGLGWSGLMTLLLACEGRSNGASSAQEGTLGLRLSTEVNHISYRLRDGVFDVSGPQTLSLSSEDALAASSLESPLTAGAYAIELRAGWRLERFGADFETVNAELTSANPQLFTIAPGQTTNISYEFLTDGTAIGLGAGAVSVAIGVMDTSQGGSGTGAGGCIPGGARDCSSALDNDCDGRPDNTIDATCTCSIGAVQECDAHPGQDGIGLCRAGEQLCSAGPNNATSQFGTCSGSVAPAASDSCTIVGDDSNCNGIPNDDCPPPPSFQANVWPIFQARCAPCHTTLRRGGHSVGSPDLNTAFADATRLGGTLIERLDGGGMPFGCSGLPGDPGCISVADLATIQLWLDTGMAP